MLPEALPDVRGKPDDRGGRAREKAIIDNKAPLIR